MQNKFASNCFLILIFLILFDTFYFLNLNLNILPVYYLGNNPVVLFPVLFFVSFFLIIKDYQKYFKSIFDQYSQYYLVIIILFLSLYFLKDFNNSYQKFFFEKESISEIILQDTKFIRPIIFFFFGVFFLKQIIKYYKLNYYQLFDVFFIAAFIDLILKVIFYFKISTINLNQLDYINSLLPCLFAFILAASLNNYSKKIIFFLFVFGFSLILFSNSKFFILIIIFIFALKCLRFIPSIKSYLILIILLLLIISFYSLIIIFLDNFIIKISSNNLNLFTNSIDEMRGYGLPNFIVSILSRINSNIMIVYKMIIIDPLFGLSIYDLNTKILGYVSHSFIIITLCYSGILGSSIIVIYFFHLLQDNLKFSSKIYSLKVINLSLLIYFLFMNDLYLFMSFLLLLNEKKFLFKKYRDKI